MGEMPHVYHSVVGRHLRQYVQLGAVGRADEDLTGCMWTILRMLELEE